MHQSIIIIQHKTILSMAQRRKYNPVLTHPFKLY